jgi:methylated-DNA-[protein]-cysteine S-methyltransferase
MNTIHIQYLNTPLGEMILGSYEGRLCIADWRDRKRRESIDKRIQIGLNATFIEKEDFVLKLAKEELEAYFKGERQTFDIPLLLAGTIFQKKVWQALMQIPYGKTVSYKELAQYIDHEKAVRSVASAVGANAISLLIPCHRVIGSDGSLIGYAGGLRAKQGLLEIENNLFCV